MNKLYRGDCKYIMLDMVERGEKFDLIYLDPPFKSDRVYNMIFNGGGISAQQKAFHDMWNFKGRAYQLCLDFENMIDQLNDDDVSRPFKDFIKAWINILMEGGAEDKKLLNYLMYMTERLILMKRLLTPSGSIFLHCDTHAIHYIKVVMDGIFGRDNFINDLIWYYKNASRGKKWFAKSHDNILWYGIDKNYTFNRDDILVPFESNMTEWRYEKGGQAGKPMPKGKTPDDVITMPSLNPMAKERRGFMTQKPVDLIKIFIKTASNPGGRVFDPFCGCGTTIAAAIELGREWCGVDISGDSCNEIEQRIREMSEVNRTDGCQYELVESNPETMREYERLRPYEKQDWLIRRIGGFPNPKKSGDEGVDGEITIHLGGDKWGKMVFSVKTGKQCKPEFVRELRGTMEQENAVMGGLMLDNEPTDGLIAAAEKAGKFGYELETESGKAAQEYDKIQILTAQEIIDGRYFLHPPTLQAKKHEDAHKGPLI